MKYFLLHFVLICVYSHSLEVQDNYYSNELDTAINQAKEQPHHYDYSNTYRYKRTTAQSIDLNRLGNHELDGTLIKSQEESTKLDVIKQNPVIRQGADFANLNLKNFQEDEAFQSPSVPSNQAIYRLNQGTASNRGIVDNNIIVSTPRP